MDVKTLVHIFPLHSTPTVYVRTGRSWRDVMELSCTIETAYIFTQGGCQVSTWFKIVPAVITLD
jgi:hypothetical protein